MEKITGMTWAMMPRMAEKKSISADCPLALLTNWFTAPVIWSRLFRKPPPAALAALKIPPNAPPRFSSTWPSCLTTPIAFWKNAWS